MFSFYMYVLSVYLHTQFCNIIETCQCRTRVIALFSLLGSLICPSRDQSRVLNKHSHWLSPPSSILVHAHLLY
jgi:hypothetical protein